MIFNKPTHPKIGVRRMRGFYGWFVAIVLEVTMLYGLYAGIIGG